MRVPSFAGQAGPCWHRPRRSLKPCTGTTAPRPATCFRSAGGRLTRRPCRHDASSSSAKALRTKLKRMRKRYGRTTSFGRGTTTSRCVNATGGTAGSLWMVPVPKRTACSGVSMSVPRLDLHAGRIWNFMRALTPETTACGSMQWTNSRCLCCRRVSLTSKCRSRSWKGPSDAQHATSSLINYSKENSQSLRRWRCSGLAKVRRRPDDRNPLKADMIPRRPPLWQRKLLGSINRGVISGCSCHVVALLEHDPEKWIPVFRKDHAHSKAQSAIAIQSDSIAL